ncbi:MAG: hypothetical protein LBT66_06030 [Methanobrevibacter sp.]|jgi:hypothetical protein|nr:hypothetical protein [Candidatus Methanovirga meridionalis]
MLTIGLNTNNSKNDSGSNIINNVLSNKITVTSDAPLNDSIEVHFFTKDDYTPIVNLVINGTTYNGTYYNFDDFFTTGFLSRYVQGGQTQTIIFQNGSGSLNIPSDIEFVVFESYGNLDESVGFSNSSSPYYNKKISISFGKYKSTSKVYSDQFDISDGLDLLKRDGSNIQSKHIIHNSDTLLS